MGGGCLGGSDELVNPTLYLCVNMLDISCIY